MLIDYVKYQKHHFTVSSEGTGTLADPDNPGKDVLQEVHTVKDVSSMGGSLWGAPAGSSQWIKLNLYEHSTVSKIILDFQGSYDSLVIETSVDNWNWIILKDEPDESNTLLIEQTGYFEKTYTEKEFVYLRLTVNNPTSDPTDPFILNGFEVYGELTFQNEHLISHNIYSFYSEIERDDFPLYPELTENMMKMMEGREKLNLKLFDSSIFANCVITKLVQSIETPTSSGNYEDTLTLSANVPVIAGCHYVWDFDDVVAEDDYEYDASNPNIIVTTDPIIPQEHILKHIDVTNNPKTGIFVPRLLVRYNTWELEFTTYHNKT